MRYSTTILISAVLAFANTTRAATVSGTLTPAGGAFQNVDLARSVVYLESNPAIPSEAADAGRRPQIAQHGKAFTPDFLVVPVGSTVEFPNWDPFSHNVFSRSRAASFDLERYGQGQSKNYTFNNAGVVQLFLQYPSADESGVVGRAQSLFRACRCSGTIFARRCASRALHARRLERAGRRTTVDDRRSSHGPTRADADLVSRRGSRTDRPTRRAARAGRGRPRTGRETRTLGPAGRRRPTRRTHPVTPSM